MRDRGAGQVSAVPEVEFTLVLKDDTLNGAKSPLSLEVSLNLEHGLNGKWEIKHSNIKEVGCVSPYGVGPTRAVFRPNTLAEAFPLNPPQVHVFKPKPTLIWQPKRKELSTRSFPMRETQPSGKSSSCPCERPIQPLSCPALKSLMVSDDADARFLNSDKIDEAKNELSALIDSIDANQVSNVVEFELLGSNESERASNGSVCSTNCDESLECDF